MSGRAPNDSLYRVPFCLETKTIIISRHNHLFIHLQCDWMFGVLQVHLCHHIAKRLIDRTWLTLDPPSQRLLLSLFPSQLLSSPSLPHSLSLSLFNRSAAFNDSTPPTGMQRGRSAAWKWHHHASCGSIRPLSTCPSCFFFTRRRRAEPYGITRKMKVSVMTGVMSMI